MFKAKGREGASIEVQLEQRLTLIYPNLSSSLPRPLLKGRVLLKLKKPKVFDQIFAFLRIVSRWKLPGDTEVREIPLWRQDVTLSDTEQELAAGIHEFPFIFSLENCTAPDCRLKRKHWELSVVKTLEARACKTGKPDLVAELNDRHFMIHQNAYAPNEQADVYMVTETHVEKNMGEFVFTYRAPQASVGNTFHVHMMFTAGSTPVKFLSISGSLEQILVWRSADSATPAEPIIEKNQMFQLVPPSSNAGLTVPAGATIELTKDTRLPRHDEITASSLDGSIATLQAAHHLVVEVMSVLHGFPTQFSIRRPITLAACTLVHDTVVLPTYDSSLRTPAASDMFISSANKSKSNNIKCVCMTDDADLDNEALAAMLETGHDLSHMVLTTDLEREEASASPTPLQPMRRGSTGYDSPYSYPSTPIQHTPRYGSPTLEESEDGGKM